MTRATQDQIDGRLAKIRWQQDLARRGQERREAVTPQLAEALRNEIRTALDAGGGPFDVNVARRVYDLAIAARDMCVAATGTVKEAIDQIKDTGGPMETLQDPDAPESAMQASETFGARLVRELVALVPSLRSGGDDDPRKLVHALAEARSRGMHDVAEELEVRLLGRSLSGSRPVDLAVTAVRHGSVEQGVSDDKQNVQPAVEVGMTADARTPQMQVHDDAVVARESVGAEAHDDASRLVLDHGGRFFELKKMPGNPNDLNVYVCGCGLPIRQFEREARACPQRPPVLVTIGYEDPRDSETDLAPLEAAP